MLAAQVSACCIAACAVGGKGLPASSSITQAQSPRIKVFSNPGARKSPSTVTFPLFSSKPDFVNIELPVTPPVQTTVPALISRSEERRVGKEHSSRWRRGTEEQETMHLD